MLFGRVTEKGDGHRCPDSPRMANRDDGVCLVPEAVLNE
jgi:hypothetical protein